jgi:uracil-DNA glycosylase family 4
MNWSTLASTIAACRRCPRLVAWREEVARVKRRAYRDEVYWGRPVPGFGDPAARLLIVGLAPGAHGANRTGRMFTGDSSGDFLYAALHRAGFASQPTSSGRDDGLTLTDAYISAACRCAPPDNKPTPDELAACLPFLSAELVLLPNIQVVVALGRIAFDAIRHAYSDLWPLTSALWQTAFAHNTNISLDPRLPAVIASYHPSRQNTQTGRLTAAMFDAVWTQACARLNSATRSATAPDY